MDLRKVLFVGGDPRRNASVQIRCVDVAVRLGCDYHLGAGRAREIPDRYAVFVCVKPYLFGREFAELAKRGKIIWDIIDQMPPSRRVALYLTSTEFARQLLQDYCGRMATIPHHHCNFGGTFNPSGLRDPGWIGYRHWRPLIPGLRFHGYAVDGMTREDVVEAHRKIGIGLNFRLAPGASRGRDSPSDHGRNSLERHFKNFHIAINSGIKLINCIGFGVPSISAVEPAYFEIGEKCTIFSPLRRCLHWVRALQSDRGLYQELRKNCRRSASRFHIDTIAEKYKILFRTI
jgi:hypothetical protein